MTLLDTKWLCARFSSCGINFYTGIPDSVLSPFCACLDDAPHDFRHIIAANEGGAVALAVGHHLATGAVGLVYMQNSGIGNAINPLLSLADRETYAIPMVLLVGWRGKPGSHDEPQHSKQGRITIDLLDAMAIPWSNLGDSEKSASLALTKMSVTLQRDPGPYALLVANNTFLPCTGSKTSASFTHLSREEAIKIVLDILPDATAFVGSTGMISRELFELRTQQDDDRRNYFMNVGAMGHTSQIATGIAINQPEKTVVCLEGDGSLLMHLGSLGTIAQIAPQNFIHIILNNQAHDSVGGQATTNPTLSLAAIAKQAGYVFAVKVQSENALRAAVADCQKQGGPAMIEVMVRKGARQNLGRPGKDLIQFKDEFTEFLK